MAKQTFTVEGALRRTMHHVGPGKVQLMATAGGNMKEFAYRFELVNANLNAVLAQVRKIRAAAEKANCKEVLALLDEETVPAGHDLSPPEKREADYNPLSGRFGP